MNEAVVSLVTWQVWVIGLVASLLVSLINWLAKPKVIRIGLKEWPIQGISIGRFWKTVLLLVVACGLGYWWFPVLLPALPLLAGLSFQTGVPVIFDWVKQLVSALMPYIGVAVFLYNTLLSYFTDEAKRKRFWCDLKDWILRRAGLLPEVEDGPN
jgi:hypothetical protein